MVETTGNEALRAALSSCFGIHVTCASDVNYIAQQLEIQGYSLVWQMEPYPDGLSDNETYQFVIDKLLGSDCNSLLWMLNDFVVLRNDGVPHLVKSENLREFLESYGPTFGWEFLSGDVVVFCVENETLGLLAESGAYTRVKAQRK